MAAPPKTSGSDWVSRPGNDSRNGLRNEAGSVSRNGARIDTKKDSGNVPLPHMMAPAYGHRSKVGLGGVLVGMEACEVAKRAGQSGESKSTVMTMKVYEV